MLKARYIDYSMETVKIHQFTFKLSRFAGTCDLCERYDRRYGAAKRP